MNPRTRRGRARRPRPGETPRRRLHVAAVLLPGLLLGALPLAGGCGDEAPVGRQIEQETVAPDERVESLEDVADEVGEEARTQGRAPGDAP